MNLDLNTIKNVHFIGIGGIGISAIARMMVHLGKNVTGQDMQDSEIVQDLIKLGIEVKIGQSFENIPADTDLIVYTIAIDNYDPELAKKIKNSEVRLPNIGEGKKVFVKSYPEMLGIISEDKYTIAVAGTHGKTTTTAMIAKVLKDTGNDPMVIVGSLIKDDNPSNPSGQTNFVAGNSGPKQGLGLRDLFVVEACEYRRSFLNINPKILVITNIEEDHLDYYKDIEDIKNAFRELAMKVPADGAVICNLEDKNIFEVVKDIGAKVINYQEFFDENLKLKIPGVHNKKDAAAAVAAAAVLGISKSEAEKSLEEFPGTWRRFEYRGKLTRGALLYDDYAHHPTEITATMEGFRELYSRDDGWEIIIVFQPHLFSRTKSLLKEFSESFTDANEVLILPIYYAREEDDGSISSEILAKKINENSNNAKAFPDFDSAEKYLRNKNLDDKSIVVTMGAGEAFKIGDNLLLK